MITNQLRRKTKLISPRLQLRLIGSFVGLAALAMLVQFLLLGYRLTTSAATIDGDSAELAATIPGLLVEVLAFSLAILLPLIFCFGIILTHRVAGPIYRFHKYLNAVAEGEVVGECRIREGDELQSLCDSINAALATVRSQSVPADSEALVAEDVGDEPVRNAA